MVRAKREKKPKIVLPKKEKSEKEPKKSRAEKKLEKEIRTTKVKRLSDKELKNMSFFARLNYKRKLRADREARRRAEDLASLPKEPVKRFFARLAPKRVLKYIFSWRGVKNFFKFCFACLLLGVIAIGGLFLYYKKDLNDIKLSDIVISETVNTYLDRNGKVLWEDTGSENYRLVVEGSEISSYMRQAIVAIEDRNFYNHPGVDFYGLVRAVISTATGKGVQGGSTLTQQLIKQVYFADEAASENRGGIARKIKELILAVELEKMYDKEQIITMYLNESPYGGRRNGVESAAQTYFGKPASELTLAESALLASIPNNPAVLNPYNEYGHEQLIWRQQYTLDVMAELGYITEEEAKEAKEVAILDQLKPESSQYENMLAPHFVLEVKSQLEEKYGVSTMRAGGFTIKTTLDYDAQEIAEDAVETGADLRYTNGSDNVALVSVDVETAQVIAMVGSAEFDNPEYGEVNATTSLLEPGSTIKPILDYTPLLMERSGMNYGPGTVLKDENIDKIYCSGYQGSCMLRNYTGKFYGNVTIRKALANSLNIPAVKALYINGIENSLEIAHALGDISYCKDDPTSAGLSIAIGSGCTIKPVEHANAYASLARGGVYKELSYVLEVKNSSGDILEEWKETPGTRVVDEEVAYLMTSILSDASARSMVFGAQGSAFGFVVPGVWTGSKTGTTTTSNSAVTKDSLMASFSTALATIVWNGNHDGRGLSNSSNTIVRRVTNDFMERVHKEVYADNGKWSSGDQPTRPAGIKQMTINGQNDLWPSWYNEKNSGVAKEKLKFNDFTKKLASSCTPANRIVELEITKVTDPMTGTEIVNGPDGYDEDEEDDCSNYSSPNVTVRRTGDKLHVVVTGSEVVGGSYSLSIDGTAKESGDVKNTSFDLSYTITGCETKVQVIITDGLGATATGNATLVPSSSCSSSSTSPKTNS